MTRAEELSIELFPYPKLENYDDILVYRADRDNAFWGRLKAKRAYEQAEQRILRIIESRIGEILGDAQPAPILRAELNELIDKIKK